MQVIYDGEFNKYPDGVYPNGWKIERHSDQFHKLGETRSGAFRILFPGNLHMPLIPPVRTGAVSLVGRGDVYSARFALKIYFRYDPGARSGYCMRHSWCGDCAETVLAYYENGNYKVIDRAEIKCRDFNKSLSQECSLRLEIGDHEFAFHHGDECAARFTDPGRRLDRPGLIAFDRAVAQRFYVADLLRIRIESDETEQSRASCPVRACEFPPDLDGMTDPWRFHVCSSRSPSRTQLDVSIEGGPADRSPSVCDFRKLRGNSRLVRPYARIEPGDGRSDGPHYLYLGSLGLKEHWEPRSSGFLPCDSEGPEKIKLLFENLPEDFWIALGHEYYAAEDRLALAGGPSEIIVCPKTGVIKYAGPALAPGVAVIEILSPPDKKISLMIPPDELRRARAVAFAQNNHFFFESEPARFSFRLRHRRTDWLTGDLALRVTLEDAFQSPMDNGRIIEFHAAEDELSGKLLSRMGVVTLVTDPVEFSGLKVGVYHARAEIWRGEQKLLEERRAFEVMADDPAAPSPPLASGLPDLISQIPDYATETGAFDPWAGRGVDAAHYLANCSIHVLPARRDRIWNLVHLYRRRWVLELSKRMTPEPELEKNADVLPHADRIYWNKRHDLWHGNYDKVVLEALVEFLVSQSFRPGREGTLLDTAGIKKTGQLSEDMYDELLGRHWKPWVEFFNQWMINKHLPALNARLRAFNQTAEWMTYGIYPPYGSVYKGAYFARYTGRDLRNGLEKFYNGPMLVEDYPYMCAYPLQRNVFMVAAMKLEAPGLKQYPEIYGVNGCADDGRVVYGMPPHGHSHAPRSYIRKSVFEHAFGAVWFDCNGFHYWDDGFHAMAWTRNHYDEFVRTWGIVRRSRPSRPLRTTAFAVSREACLAHPDIFTPARPSSGFEHGHCMHDVVNTAEEAPAFAYERARLDGQMAGFVADMASIDSLDPADVHTLVLPPLAGVSPEFQAAARRLHERGVALVGLEDAGELADLFGVRRRHQEVQMHALRLAPVKDEIWSSLPAGIEQCETSHCCSVYDAGVADTVLEGLDASGNTVGPAFVCNKTKWGRTAFFAVPPTMVKRLDLEALVSYGKESRSVLANSAMALALRWVGRPPVETTAGKLIGFYDRAGRINIVIMEDAHPARTQTIHPVLTIHFAGLSRENVKCDHEMNFIENNYECLRIGLVLEPHAAAHILITPPVK